MNIVKARTRVRIYWVHLLFTVIILLGHLQFWWLFWSSRQVAAWSFFPFMFLLLQPITLYLLAGLCFPDFSDAGEIDLRDFYFHNHSYLFGLLGLLMLLIGSGDMLLGSVPWLSQGNAVKASVLIIGVAGATSHSPRIHAILVLLTATAMAIGLFTFGLELR